MRAGTSLIAVVVVNYNSHGLLDVNLRTSGLARVATVIVVDNSTSALEQEAVRTLADTNGWVLETVGNNIGFGAAVNRGAATAVSLGAEVIILLNPDASITPEDAIALATRATPSVIASPTIEDGHGHVWFSGGVLNRFKGVASHQPGATDWLTGACMAIHVDAWRKLGGFDERFFLYWEDVEMCTRWLALGGELIVSPAERAVHEAGGTQQSAHAGKSLTYVRFNSRNRLLFSLDRANVLQRLTVLAYTPIYSYRLIRRARVSHLRDVARVVATILQGAVQGITSGVGAKAGTTNRD